MFRMSQDTTPSCSNRSSWQDDTSSEREERRTGQSKMPRQSLVCGCTLHVLTTALTCICGSNDWETYVLQWIITTFNHDHIVKSATHFEELLDVLGVAAVDSREEDAEPVL